MEVRGISFRICGMITHFCADSDGRGSTVMSICNVAGINFTNYVLKPGETVETPIVVDGVYIVNKKKLFVK